MKTKSNSKRTPAYIAKIIRKSYLASSRKSKAALEDRMKKVLEKGLFETALDVVEFELGLSSQQLKRLGSLYLIALATGIQGRVTPQEVLEMAKPYKMKKIKRPPCFPSAPVGDLSEQSPIPKENAM